MISLFDRFLAELDGESVVSGDAQTERLDALLAEVRTLPPEKLASLVAEVDRLRTDAQSRLTARTNTRAILLERVIEWDVRAAEHTGSLAEHARDRARALEREAAGVAEEVAEYAATVHRLDEITALLRRGPAD